ncbi:MAG: DUF2934 domain-containing protein [Chthoniobacteraceae bacterium]
MKKHKHDHDENNEPTHSQIAALAYFIYEEEGCIPGNDAANWNAAESMLRRQIKDLTSLVSNDGASRDGSRPRLEMSTR